MDDLELQSRLAAEDKFRRILDVLERAHHELINEGRCEFVTKQQYRIKDILNYG